MMLLFTYILSWLFGLFFLSASIVLIFDTFIGGLILIAVSLFLIPPVRYLIFRYTKVELEVWSRLSLILLLLMTLGAYMSFIKQPAESNNVGRVTETQFENNLSDLLEAEISNKFSEELEKTRQSLNN